MTNIREIKRYLLNRFETNVDSNGLEIENGDVVLVTNGYIYNLGDKVDL